ncbi:Hypothetical predicted protein [Paramuricea clavata]|uniref:Uncharacterized protein n=1 Tax=Paramuricea clavata TaxID=317549 RepID=A0A6S7FX42_PARCT|nr:Hypothetical predicted protein [Paramuricea clavata]
MTKAVDLLLEEFKKRFGKYPEVSSSTIIFDKMKLTVNKTGTKINGATFKDVKIIISKNGKMIYSTDKNKQSTELVDSVLENIVERMDDELSNQSEALGNSTVISENELKELRGILNVKGNSGKEKIDHLEIETERTAGREQKALLYEAMADMTELKADEIRLRSNERPKGPRAMSIVEEEVEINDLTRFERFKKWAKENISGISVVAMSVAGIITTIIMGARSVAKKGEEQQANSQKQWRT